MRRKSTPNKVGWERLEDHSEMSGNGLGEGMRPTEGDGRDDLLDRRSWAILVLIFASTAVIFVVDITTPLGLGVSILYIVPVMLSVLLSRTRFTVALSIVMSVLVIVAFFFKPSSGSTAFNIAVANRAIIIASIWVTAEVSALAKRTVEFRRMSEDLRREVGEHKAAKLELARQRERLAITLASIGDGVIATDAAGSVVLMNPVAERLTGWKKETALGRNVDDVLRLVDGKERKPINSLAREVMLSDRVVQMQGDTLLLTDDGREVPVADSAAPVRDDYGNVAGSVVVFRDNTTQMRFISELERASRLESIGLLAGGIAHDFNNVLTVIDGKIAVARLRANEQAEVDETLIEAQNAAERGKMLARELLTFARGGAPIRREADLGRVIIDSTRFALAGANVECRFDIPGDLWSAEIDEGQIGQAIQNLVINAKESMPEGGVVEVAARNVMGCQPTVRSSTGRLVQIEIRDHGVGIEEAHMQHVFDPYFSTKGEGRGLGLAVVHSVIQKHGGAVLVDSKVGVGTKVTIELPSSGVVMERPAAVEMPLQRGSGRVLWMDDEPGVLEVGSELLRILGYEVECARDGEEALRLCATAKEAGRPFRLAILDLTVPGGMGGKEAAVRLKGIDPEVSVVVCSGYSNSPIMANFRENGFEGVLQKPFTVNDLASLVKSLTSG